MNDEAMFAPTVPPIEVDERCHRCGAYLGLFYPDADITDAWEDEEGGAWCSAPQHDCPWDEDPEDADIDIRCAVCESRPHHFVVKEDR